MASKVRDCDCGFVDSKDPTKTVFSSFLAINFSSITSGQLDDLFITATYSVSQRDSPYTRNFSADQVQLSDDGLDLTVSPPSSGSKDVPCAQIISRSSNFFYGSYHALFRVGNVPGTVTAFFNYKNDSSEVDIEYLSSWKIPTLLYTVKPQIYQDNGSPDNSTYQRQSWNDSVASFDQEFHQWSFVWLPDIVHYGLDSNYSKVLTTNVPQAPGKLALSQWSDGNSNYSLGPPTKSGTVTVAALWAVYNDTNAAVLKCKKATSACTVTDGVFQSSSSSGGSDDNNDSSSGVISMNSSHLTSPPPAHGWLLVFFFFFFWFSCRRTS